MDEYEGYDYIKGENEVINGLYINGIKYSYTISKLEKIFNFLIFMNFIVD